MALRPHLVHAGLGSSPLNHADGPQDPNTQAPAAITGFQDINIREDDKPAADGNLHPPPTESFSSSLCQMCPVECSACGHTFTTIHIPASAIDAAKPGTIITGEWVREGFFIFANGITPELVTQIQKLSHHATTGERTLNDPRPRITATGRRIYNLQTPTTDANLIALQAAWADANAITMRNYKICRGIRSNRCWSLQQQQMSHRGPTSLQQAHTDHPADTWTPVPADRITHRVTQEQHRVIRHNLRISHNGWPFQQRPRDTALVAEIQAEIRNEDPPPGQE